MHRRTFVLALTIALLSFLLLACADLTTGTVYDNSATAVPGVWDQEMGMRDQIETAPTVIPIGEQQ